MLISSLIGTLKVLGNIAVLVAAGLHARRQELIDSQGTAMLSRLVISVLNPCLLVTTLAALNARQLWATSGISLCCAIYITIGCLTGRACSGLLGLDPEYHRTFVVGCAFGNGMSFPLVMVTALLGAYPALSNYTTAEAVALASLYMPVHNILLWSLGYIWLGGAAPQADANPASPRNDKPLDGVVACLRRLNNGSMNGLVVGLTMAATPALQRLWADPGIGWLRSAIEMVGAAAIPCSMICLGSSLLAQLSETGPGKEAAVRPVVAMCCIRLVWMPCVEKMGMRNDKKCVQKSRNG